MVELRSVGGARAVLIAGPTASGKSEFALEMARQRRGTIINADSMQVYTELRVLTARPSVDDEETVPHRLYGHVPAMRRYSVGIWLGEVAEAIGEAERQGRLPIVVGGTGLYFKALCEGLAQVPAIPAQVSEENRSLAWGVPSAVLHRRLAAIDPADARLIRPSDRARILRAFDVFVATGRPLAAWQAEPVAAVVDPTEGERLILDPDRASLHRRIEERTKLMLSDGALAEVGALSLQQIPPDLPAMKAIGVRQLIDHMSGAISLDEALAGIQTETRRYAKRQMTWFRNQMGDWRRVAV